MSSKLEREVSRNLAVHESSCSAASALCLACFVFLRTKNGIEPQSGSTVSVILWVIWLDDVLLMVAPSDIKTSLYPFATIG